jgi:hypothetical protein
MPAEQYGNSYWCIKVPQNISPNGEIYVFADRVEITSNGDLIFWREKDEKKFQNLVLASASWLVFFAASVIDGGAVAVEYWEGEVTK